MLKSDSFTYIYLNISTLKTKNYLVEEKVQYEDY